MALRITRLKPEHRKIFQSYNRKAAYTHRHMDWLEPEDILDNGLIFLLFNENQIIGSLGVSSENDHYRWLQFFIVYDELQDIRKVWTILWRSIKTQPELSGCCILTVPVDSGMRYCLQTSAFHQNGSIVYFEVPSDASISIRKENLNTKVRISALNDSLTETLLQLVEPAFPIAWRLSKINLSRAVNSSNITYLAQINRKPAGYLLAFREENSIHISRIAVSPAMQNQGIGMTMMAQLLAEYPNTQETTFSVNTYSQDAGAIQFYKKLGFIQSNQSYPVYFYR